MALGPPLGLTGLDYLNCLGQEFPNDENKQTSKNQCLDPKVCADPLWLLVIKNGLKKHSSLIND